MDDKLLEFEANFSVLDRYGTDITKEEYITNPAIGREEQIKQLILILLTPEKSAILIGKPGIGKTAIVEGLAWRLQKDDVPEALKGYSIVNIKTASLLGTLPSGESKVQKMIDELKKKEKLILFIDEIHMLIGATDSSSLDFANIFKEGLGRGSIKVIGATTTEEYERYILRDKAFTRRFQKIEIPEPSREDTIKIMMGTLPKFEKQTGTKMKYSPFLQERIMGFLVDITSEYKRVYALGSRYPDVCLTLLKQAFANTVYDSRQYMDIFDIRKAIENSKNIYPDVIKKELPNFDKMFNNLILEEKGEKPVEAWRQDYIEKQTEAEPETEEEKETVEKIEDAPKIINRGQESEQTSSISKDSSGIPQDYKKIIRKSGNAKNLDELLLSGTIDVITKDSMKNKIETSVKEPEADENILDDVEETDNSDKEDNDDSENRNGGDKMQEDRRRPVRQDINTQNFDKYNNFFSQDANRQDNNPANDFVRNNQPNNGPSGMGGPNNPNNGFQQYGPQNGMNPNMPPQGNYGPQGNMPPQGNFQNNMPPRNNGYYPNNQMGPNGAPNGMNPMNRPMYNNPNMPPQGNFQNNMPPRNNGFYPNNQMGPNGMNPNMPPQGNNQPNRFFGNNQMQPVEQKSNKVENIFGAPMYDDPSSKTDPYANIPDIYGPLQQPKPVQQNNYVNTNAHRNSFFGNNQPQQQNGYTGESIFGAPMYSSNEQPVMNQQSAPGVDIFGQLITDNMTIKNGKIVDEFPKFDKLNNFSDMKTIVSETEENPQSGTGDGNFLPVSNMPQNIQNPQMSTIMPNQIQLPEQQINNNKNWTFIDDTDPNQQVQPEGFQNDILEAANKKEENNILPSANSTAPTSNADYYEDMKSEAFVNLNDLNSGKIKEEDVNKYMGIPSSENKPQFDLNLESGSKEEDEFDDFYE